MNTVAIIGKPNVGKSSLFNKLIGKRKSIVHDEAGITRDRIYADVEWIGKKIRVIDTGGIEIEDKPFQSNIKMQAQIAITEAEVILFMVDGINGLTRDDEYVVSLLRKSNRKVILVVNKLEGNKEMDASIWSAGLSDIYKISAIHGEGVGDLLDFVLDQFEDVDKETEAHTKIAIIGRPNAGKSSLLNQLASNERAIVSEISGTTRDSVNSNIEIKDRTYTIIDTAGINRKSKLLESVDHYALVRAMNSIKDADIVILMIDYERELSHFDSVVGGYIDEQNKPTIIVINKWDLPKKENDTMKKREHEVRDKFKFMSWAPIEFISAKTGLRLDKLKNEIIEVDDSRSKLIKTSILNEVMNDIQIIQPAQTFAGGRLNIKFIKQVDAHIPTFIIWVNNMKYLHFTYKRFLENKLREYFGFKGTPIRLVFRNNKGDKNER